MERAPQTADAVHTTRYAVRDLAFRVLFSSIFVGLGGEHIFSDRLLQLLMPEWVPYPRAVSIACGIFLLAGSATILLGFHVRRGAQALALFLVVVTVSVHLPGLFGSPPGVAAESEWLWDMFQRSNFVKNICLLGVCIYLMEHRPGRFSLDYHRAPSA
ncbi:MAG: DoxX family protein [Planctomycetes bacterium]|nr:DoxX family protein [Planctomycetota bacterium]